MIKHILQKCVLVLQGESDALNIEQEEGALVTESVEQYDVRDVSEGEGY